MPLWVHSRTARLAAVCLTVAGTLAFTNSQSFAASDDAVFDCVTQPSVRANLGSQVPGLIAEVLVSRGDHVVAGQVVARLVSDVEEAQVALDRLRASSTAEIEARQVHLDLARRELARTEELFSHQVASAQRLDELRAGAQVAEGELKLALRAQEVTKLEQMRSEALLRQREIRSPIDGLVTEQVMAAGEYVHPEAVIARIARLDPLFVETYLPVRLFPSIQVGMQATVTSVAPLGGATDARVTVIDQVFDAASATFGVRLQVASSGSPLPAGARCQVRFNLPTPALGRNHSGPGNAGVNGLAAN